MMKSIKKIIILLTLICLVKQGYSQLSVSYYSSSLSKIGLGYNFSNRVWGEVRLYSNTIIYDTTPELVFCANLVGKERYCLYLGVGGVVNYFNGIVVPFGVQFTPFDKMGNFTLHIELEPTVDFDSDIILQSSFGIRFIFGR